MTALRETLYPLVGQKCWALSRADLDPFAYDREPRFGSLTRAVAKAREVAATYGPNARIHIVLHHRSPVDRTSYRPAVSTVVAVEADAVYVWDDVMMRMGPPIVPVEFDAENVARRTVQRVVDDAASRGWKGWNR